MQMLPPFTVGAHYASPRSPENDTSSRDKSRSMTSPFSCRAVRYESDSEWVDELGKRMLAAEKSGGKVKPTSVNVSQIIIITEVLTRLCSGSCLLNSGMAHSMLILHVGISVATL